MKLKSLVEEVEVRNYIVSLNESELMELFESLAPCKGLVSETSSLDNLKAWSDPMGEHFDALSSKTGCLKAIKSKIKNM